MPDSTNNTESSLRSGFLLGKWTVLPLENRLTSDDVSRRIQPKSMDVLLQLAMANGETVERETLQRHIWGERAVSDEPLTRCIGELRKALGDRRSNPEFIETIPKRGYRLLKSVSLSATASTNDFHPAGHRWSAQARISVTAVALLLFVGVAYVALRPSLHTTGITAVDIDRSIAVMPFVDMSAAQDQEYMADGVAEELLNLLARNSDLRVISRSSSFSLKGRAVDIRSVAAQFNVGYVLEGSVRATDDRIRVTAKLIDGRTDTRVWSETYERPLGDVFAIQDDIAQSVAASLQLTLLSEPQKSRPTHPEAYALFLKGRSLHEQPSGDSMQQALDYYKQALKIDPDYVPAWVWLAALYDDTINSLQLPRDEIVQLARNAIKRALEIDPYDPLALGMDAVLIAAWDNSLPRAAARMQQALQLEPGNPILLRWSGIVLTGLGRHEEAVRINEYLFERDPVGNITRINLAEVYMNAGRFEDAVHICEIEVSISSTNSPCGSRLILASVYAGKPLDARALLDAAQGSRVHTRLAPIVYHATGDLAGFEQAFDTLKAAYLSGDRGLGYWIVHTYAVIGDANELFDWLEQFGAEVPPYIPPNTTYFSDLEADPRWQQLMTELGQNPADLAAIPFEIPILSVSH